MMLVPDPRSASESVKARLLVAFAQMKARQTGPLVDVDADGPELSGELALADRQELDDATLELLGIADAAERARMRHALYDQITHLYREIRRGERDMQRHRTNTSRRTRPTAQSLAREIWAGFAAPPLWQTPADFLDPSESRDVFTLPPGPARVVHESLFRGAGLQCGVTFLETGDVTCAQYLKAHAQAQLWGEVAVPTRPEACEAALCRWKVQTAEQTERFEAEAAARTVVPALQKRIVAELWKLTRSGSDQ